MPRIPRLKPVLGQNQSDISNDYFGMLVSLLGDLNRLRIFALLRNGELCVYDIQQAIQLPQNLVSHHLRVLRNDDLLQSRKDGRWVYYSINKTTLAGLHPVLCELFDPSLVKNKTASQTAQHMNRT